MQCPRCDAVNDDNGQFCFNCGAPLQRSQPAPAAGSPTIVIRPDDPVPGPLPVPAPPPQAPPAYAPPPDTQPPQAYGQPQQLAQPPAYGAQPQAYPPSVPNSTAAVISLIFGIVSWFALPLIGAIVAVIAGHMARAEIRLQRLRARSAHLAR
jgi:hypothetical protein